MSMDITQTNDSFMLLYIHPHGHLNDLVIPAGSISCINSITCHKLGRYSFEVTRDEILAASVIAVDFHWALSICGLEEIISYIRKLSPLTPIIVGGISAGHYAESLIHDYKIDYVISGDSEISFNTLVKAIATRSDTRDIPNLFSKKMSPAKLERMNRATFSALDYLTTDWFPTYEKVSEWQAKAFGQGKTIIISRGCRMRCPNCYGSYASTYGTGHLFAMPEDAARQIKKAEKMGVENLRIIVCKPSSEQLSELIDSFVKFGPYEFATTVGFYLCTPLLEENISSLERTFHNNIAISAVSPLEHFPQLAPKVIAYEMKLWRNVAARANSSKKLHLDIWASTATIANDIKKALATEHTKNVSVSLSTVWSMTRPTDGKNNPSIGSLRKTLSDVWTFYAARLLSPYLSRKLEPFRFLDEIFDDPNHAECLNKPDIYSRKIAANWQKHSLPLLPGLGFSVTPAVALKKSPAGKDEHGIHYLGKICTVRSDQVNVPKPATPFKLTFSRDHKGVTLGGSFLFLKDFNALIFTPHLEGVNHYDHDFFSTTSLDWLTMIVLPENFLKFHDQTRITLKVSIVVQEALITLENVKGEIILRCKASLDYYNLLSTNINTDSKNK